MCSCDPLVRYSAGMTSRGSSWAVEFELPSLALFQDSNGDTWGGNGESSATLSYSRVGAGYQIPMEYLKTLGTQDVVERSTCIGEDYCCTTTQGSTKQYVLQPSTTIKTYDLFQVSTPNPVFDFFIAVTIRNYTWTLELNQDHLSASWNPNKRSEDHSRSCGKSDEFSQKYCEFRQARSRLQHAEILSALHESKAKNGGQTPPISWRVAKKRKGMVIEDQDFSLHTNLKSKKSVSEALDDVFSSALIEAKVTPMAISSYSVLKGGEIIAIDRTWLTPPFILPSSAMSSLVRGTPTYSKASFKRDMAGACTLAAAQALVYYGGVPNTDVFSQYKFNSILTGSFMVSIDDSSRDPKVQPNWLLLTSNDQAAVLTDTTLATSAYTLVRVYAEPIVTDKGIYVIAPSQTPTSPDSATSLTPSLVSATEESFNAFIYVSNTARVAGAVTVKPWRCCYSPIDSSGNIVNGSIVMSCASLFTDTITSSVNASGVQKFEFKVPYIPYGQSGRCDFNLSADQNPDTNVVSMGFEILPKASATPSGSQAPTTTVTVGDGSATVCVPPNVKISSAPYCKSPCEIDQSWLNTTLDAYLSANPSASNTAVAASTGGICVAVDCITKYKGSRNIYNPLTGLCTTTPATTVTTPVSSSIPVTSTPLGINPATTTPPTSILSPVFLLQPDGTYTIDCGSHGVFNPTTSTCDCDEGWITNINQPQTSYAYCDQKGLSSGLVLTGGDKTKNKAVLIGVITGLSIAFLIFIALLCCACKRVRNCCCRRCSKKKKNDSSSALLNAIAANPAASAGFVDYLADRGRGGDGALDKGDKTEDAPATDDAASTVKKASNKQQTRSNKQQTHPNKQQTHSNNKQQTRSGMIDCNADTDTESSTADKEKSTSVKTENPASEEEEEEETERSSTSTSEESSTP